MPEVCVRAVSVAKVIVKGLLLLAIDNDNEHMCLRTILDDACAVQGLLCGVLQVIIQKLSEQDVTKAGVTAFADTIMEALLSVFACHSSTVHEEAMLAVGALTYACGTQFNKYMERFYPYLKLGLENHQVRTPSSILA